MGIFLGAFAIGWAIVWVGGHLIDAVNELTQAIKESK